ncbi:MAG: NADH-quinone oxidoreductase subunit J [Pseudomonadales bacterium]|nr:NADH-quinone oxidoreductase subunit J [Pseudomonadales bacterium]
MQEAFYICALVALLATLGVVTNARPVHALLYLVVSLLAVAGVFFALGAPFAGALEVIVYAGAIMVLFLFVIMLLNLGPDDLPPIMNRKVKWLYAALSAVLVALLMAMDLGRRLPEGGHGPAGEVGAIGDKLFGDYLLPFEITALLLLVAIVGSVVMAHREPRR